MQRTRNERVLSHRPSAPSCFLPSNQLWIRNLFAPLFGRSSPGTPGPTVSTSGASPLIARPIRPIPNTPPSSIRWTTGLSPVPGEPTASLSTCLSDPDAPVSSDFFSRHPTSAGIARPSYFTTALRQRCTRHTDSSTLTDRYWRAFWSFECPCPPSGLAIGRNRSDSRVLHGAPPPRANRFLRAAYIALAKETKAP